LFDKSQGRNFAVLSTYDTGNNPAGQLFPVLNELMWFQKHLSANFATRFVGELLELEDALV
jgi:hypothetical protein